jgi:NADH:ubiquinone oxidoreductase subunit F (NADH-binding)
VAHSGPAVAAEVDGHHLLGYPTDLAGHMRAHGPLPVLDRNETSRRAVASGLEASGLLGRGGGGFPSFTKLVVAAAGGRKGAVVVNAMEGEPASDKDKLLLMRAPHLVLDGAQILASLTDASRILVCVPTGREAVANAVAHAIAERRTRRYSPLPETLVRPPDRFVAGEESALVSFIDSGSSAPTFRPDKSAPLRVGKRAALVHNAETLAHVALIARHGSGPFRARGLRDEPGTCLITIGGAVTQPGVVEVDRGTPLWEIVRRGAPTDMPRALLVGGYGGTWVGPEHFTTPCAAGPLRAIGASAGVGVIVVLGPSSCGIAETARVARYLASQSAGQCGPCAFGLPAIADDLAHLARGQEGHNLLIRLQRRLVQVSGRGACRHPDGAVALVRSALTVFATDVETHGRGMPCSHHRHPTSLRFPTPIAL